MNSDQQLATFKRHFLAVLLGALPAFGVGFYVGSFASGVGLRGELSSICTRALICAAPVGLLAAVAPRTWLLPSLIYGYAFYGSYVFFDKLGDAVGTFLVIPVTIVTGKALPPSPQGTHADLLWLYFVAFCLAALVSILRAGKGRTADCADLRG